MTIGGWIIMLISTLSVASLFSWCIWKVLTTEGEEEKLHGFEIETPDKKNSVFVAGLNLNVKHTDEDDLCD